MTPKTPAGSVVPKTKTWKERHALVGRAGPKHFMDRFVLAPACAKKMFWDLLSALFIAYDIVALPLMAFGYDDLEGARMATMTATFFWTLDMILSFFCGYHRSDGLIETHLYQTMKKYFLTWFPLDIVVVSLDWSLLSLGVQSDEAVSAGRINKVVRFFRIIKVLKFTRLVRVMKLVHIFREICQYVLAGHLVNLLNLIRLLSFLSIFVHYIACSWFALGDSFSAEQDSWLRSWRERDVGMLYLYAISFHWSMAQFLPAPVREHPANVYERVFTILVLLSGFVVFSSALGSVTALITRTRLSAYNKLEEAHALREFFQQNQVSHTTASRVIHFDTSTKIPNHTLVVDDIRCFQILPPSLREDLLYEVHMGTLTEYVFLDALDYIWRPATKVMCKRAVIDAMVPKGEAAFHIGAKALCMRFVRSGCLAYNRTDEDDPDPSEDVKITEPEDYLSEAALWMPWAHNGAATAIESTRIVSISTDGFAQVMLETYPRALKTCMDYAALFIERARDALSPVLGQDAEIDDTFRAFTAKEDLWSLLEMRVTKTPTSSPHHG